MPLSKTRWLQATLVGSGLMCAGVWGTYGYFPSLADLADPLAEPPALGAQMTGSARDFDRLTSVMVSQQIRLPGKVGALFGVAGDLERLVDEAGGLDTLATEIGEATGRVVKVAEPLPARVAGLTARGGEGASLGGKLEGTLSGVSTEIGRVSSRLSGLVADVAGLGSRAAEIAARLAEIERSSAGLAPLGRGPSLRPPAPVLPLDLLGGD